MNILILGSGGRECAIAWKLSQSVMSPAIYIAPGNGGTLEYGQNISLSILDFPAIELFCIENAIDMIVCGSEAPAVHGLWDYFQKDSLKNISVIAPSMASAMLEGSKAYAKSFMNRHGIPTAEYIEVDVDSMDRAYEWFEKNVPPYVIKADGLAEGKGVVLPESKEDAIQSIDQFVLQKRFGNSSEKVVIEEFLDGIEFSVFIYTNGIEYVVLPNAKDYKRRYENNLGLNTGGMGCISPVPFVDELLMQRVESQIIMPTIQGLRQDNMPYQGFIYFGLINCDGQPKVIEYNCRLGDPEAEVILPRYRGDLLELFLAGLKGELSRLKMSIDPRFAATIMLVSDGYPEAYKKGLKITGIENVHQADIFHAGTTLADHQLVTNGGRVLAVTAMGDTLSEALSRGYDAISRIRFEGMGYRSDIGFEFS